MERFLGAHVSISGGFEKGIENGNALGVNTIQVHPCAPQRWNFKPFATGFEDAFLKAKESSTVKKVYFHGIYLINLANPDPKQASNSRNSLIHDLELMDRIKGEGVIFHVGSMKHQEDANEGYQCAADSINYIMDKTKHASSRLLLEVAAGSGQVIGHKLEDLEIIYDKVECKERVGFALDTQHLWASGYDLVNDLEGLIAAVKKHFNLEKVFAIHLNDSKTAHASKTDRHENLGDGLIGEAAIRKIINHPDLKNIPFILETPGLKEMETAKVEINKLKEWALG